MAALRHVLAFDSALNGCSAALLDVGHDKCMSESAVMDRGQAEQLVPMIDRVLKQAGAAYKDIDLIAVTVGPGAFTGLRIGLSTARAIGLALDKPVAGVTTLEVIARRYFQDHKARPDETLAVVLDTKRADYYAQFFTPDGSPLNEPLAASADDIITLARGKRLTAVGDGIARFRVPCGGHESWRFVDGYEHPDPGFIAKIAAERGAASATPQPLYLRPPDVSTPKKKLRVLIED
jgi:tRNA threonylcarbamoyladenosine biosynthesis protein TsaB